MLEILIRHSVESSGVKLQHEMGMNKTYLMKPEHNCSFGLLQFETKTEIYRYFGEGIPIVFRVESLYPLSLKMEAIYSSETSEKCYQIT
jgi:hypothetical protein